MGRLTENLRHSWRCVAVCATGHRCTLDRDHTGMHQHHDEHGTRRWTR